MAELVLGPQQSERRDRSWENELAEGIDKRERRMLPPCGHSRYCSTERSERFPRLRRHRDRDMELGRDRHRDMELGRDRDMELGRDRHRDMELGRDRDMELGRDNDGDWPCEAAGPSAGAAPGRDRGRCAGSAGAEPGAQWRSPGSSGAGPGAPGAAAPGSEDEEGNPAEEEDEEVWEDGDSGRQRLGKAQVQVLDEVLPFPRARKPAGCEPEVVL
ncbi:ATP-dependent RNA helicase DHX8-like [Vidua chalybeata]|uniref:ATP-dependent RNA helicase DHX8-like n=1 Tax=Vidua chalybeata TaxID=81927 RepID=UPI0023A7A769|nr:ATP-dependent RNA helicase DHX8-like [Vidua chalybeata]